MGKQQLPLLAFRFCQLQLNYSWRLLKKISSTEKALLQRACPMLSKLRTKQTKDTKFMEFTGHKHEDCWVTPQALLAQQSVSNTASKHSAGEEQKQDEHICTSPPAHVWPSILSLEVIFLHMHLSTKQFPGDLFQLFSRLICLKNMQNILGA